MFETTNQYIYHISVINISKSELHLRPPQPSSSPQPHLQVRLHGVVIDSSQSGILGVFCCAFWWPDDGDRQDEMCLKHDNHDMFRLCVLLFASMYDLHFNGESDDRWW